MIMTCLRPDVIMKIVIFANIVHTDTLTGGDKIMVEFAKKWSGGNLVRIVTNGIGRQYCQQNGFPPSGIKVWNTSWSDRFGVYVAMLTKAIVCSWRSVFFFEKGVDVCFASSLFLPDLIPALMLKLRNPRAKLVGAAYLLTGRRWGSDYSGGKLKGSLFYINELIFLHCVKIFRGAVLTASEYDRQKLVRERGIPAENVLAIRGGVDVDFFQSVLPQPIRFDAVFVGRFHPQKGLPELMEIWSQAVACDSRRTLALVGGGKQENELRSLVRDKKLENNVQFMGMLDGTSKAQVLKSSKMFLSASKYDSGNIALDEALACGIPGIVYDLPHLNYPKGVIKVPIGDQSAFVREIKDLLGQDEKWRILGLEALGFARGLDWRITSRQALNFISEK